LISIVLARTSPVTTQVDIGNNTLVFEIGSHITIRIREVCLTGSSVVPKSIKPVDLGCAEFSTFSDVLAA
jgi:hypothetical protein